MNPDHRIIATVILCVDPPEGWAVYVDGDLVGSGTVDPFDSSDIYRVCAWALQMASPDAVLVVEQAVPIKSARRINGGSRRMWQEQWKRACKAAKVTARHLQVMPPTWRATSLGHGRLGTKKSREKEAVVAARIKGEPVTDHNEAAAISIGQWAIQARRVFEVLPPTRRKYIGETIL